ncbi:hypothetical protein MKW98_028104, partial [Papaver atlanticum]
EKVKVATEKRKRLIDGGLVDPMDIDNDELTEVFGPDKGKSGLLGRTILSWKGQPRELQSTWSGDFDTSKMVKDDDDGAIVGASGLSVQKLKLEFGDF